MCGKKALSVAELIIVLIILGIVAALTIPQFSQAAATPDEGALLRERVKILRVAIERYYQDHGAFPGQRSDGDNADGTGAAFVAQLMNFTDDRGRVSDVRDAVHRLGPYLRNGMLPCPVPPRLGLSGVQVVGGSVAPAFMEQAADAGWVYNCDTGQVTPNSNATDATGRSYASY